MSNLSVDHAYLYNRIRLKAIVHVLLGSAIIFSPDNSTAINFFANTVVSQVFGLQNLGILFLLVGIAITYSMFRPANNYRVARYALAVSAVYSLMWWAALALVTVSSGFEVGLITTIFWGYWVTNLYYVVSDPGWRTIQLKKLHVEVEDDRLI